MIKKIFAVMIMLAVSITVVCGCAEQNSTADIQDRLIGGWMSVNEKDDSYVYNDDGTLAKLTVYEFTPTQIRYHFVTLSDGSVKSGVIYNYIIENGKVKIIDTDDTTQFGYTTVEFSDDGQLTWNIPNSEPDVFRPITDEEIAKYQIPLGKEIVETNAQITVTQDSSETS